MSTKDVCGEKPVRKNAVNKAIRYQLIDQRRYNFVTIKDLRTEEQYIIHALQLVKNDEMINGFEAWEACKIGIIAGNACYDPPPPADPFS